MSTLANPILITGASGSVAAVNLDQDGYGAGDIGDGAGSGDIGAGAPDPTAWCEWVCPATGYYRFDTRGAGTTAPTSIAGYVLSASPHMPVIMADLTLETYVSSGKENGAYGYEWGALIAFACTAGSTYYINVYSRIAGVTGNISLEWAPFSFTTLGACGACTPAAGGLCLIGSAAMGDMTTATALGPGGSDGRVPDRVVGSYNFGSQTSGWYIVLYCGGAISVPSGEWTLGDTASLGPCVLYSLGSGTFYGWYNGTQGQPYPFQSYSLSFTPGQIVNDGGQFWVCTAAVTYAANNQWPTPGPTGGISGNDPTHWAVWSNYVGMQSGTIASYVSQQDCEVVGACTKQTFCHSGGNIELTWAEPMGYSNCNPNPTFALLKFIPSQQCTVSLASIGNTGASGGGYNYSVSMTIRNNNLRFASGPFSLQLTNAADVSSSSGTVAISSLAANSSTTATFTFYSASTDSLTGVFQLINCNGDNDGGTLTILLAQALVSVARQAHTHCSNTCSSLCTYSDQIAITNVGVVPVSNVSFTITCTAALFAPTMIQDTTGQGSLPNSTICAESFTASSLTSTTGSLPPNVSSLTPYAYIHYGIMRSSSAAPNNQTLTVATHLTSGAITFPNYTVTESML